MEYGNKVKVFTDEVVGWEDAILVDRYSIVEKNIVERWGIETESGVFIVRYVKASKELKQDGCGYLVSNAEEVLTC